MDLDDYKQHRKTRRVVKKSARSVKTAIELLGAIMTEGISQLDTSLDNIAGDINRLVSANQTLTDALAAAGADKDAAVAAAQAEFAAALAPLVAKAAAIDAAGGSPEPEVPPTDPETPEEPPVEEPPVEEPTDPGTPTDPETPVDAGGNPINP